MTTQENLYYLVGYDLGYREAALPSSGQLVCNNERRPMVEMGWHDGQGDYLDSGWPMVATDCSKHAQRGMGTIVSCFQHPTKNLHLYAVGFHSDAMNHWIYGPTAASTWQIYTP